MKLKSIYLVGFKSFADKTLIEINDDFTVVVGPNGSGKSNIIDAVKWVFGEQSSKSLRGNSMSDFIFAGSSTRKALNYAEVTITIDNSDRHIDIEYSEISITRRVFRNGENEYLLNNEKCRLKDISELMMDSGIGRDSFSIISQGRVEEILSSKPESRRKIFEEASGVIKYNTKKNVARKKLDITETNLERINDILLELNGRLTPLKIQNDKAIKFKKYSEELKNYEITYLVHEIEENSVKYTSNDKELIKIEVEEIQISRELDDLNKSLDEVNKSEYENKINIEKTREAINNKKEQLRELDFNFKTLMENKKLSSTSDIDKKVIDLSNQKHELELEVSRLKSNIEASSSKLDNAQNKYRSLKEKLFNLENDKKEKESRKYLLNNLINQGNTQFSVKKIMENKDLIHGIHDTVIKSCNTDLKYSTAIETSLGAMANNIIVNTQEDAKRAIEFIKKNKYGRATFLPINTIKSYGEIKDLNIINKEFGFIDIASNLIDSDTTYNEIFKALLSKTIIVDNLDNAIKISKKINNKYKIVTLDGEVMNAGGSMTGGRNNKSNNSLLKNKNELDKLIFEIKNLDEDINKTKVEYHEKYSILQELEISKLSNKNKLEDSNTKLNLITSEYNHLNHDDSSDINEEQKINDKRITLNKEIEDNTNKLSTMIDSNNQVRQEVENINIKIRNTNDYYRGISKKLTDFKVNKETAKSKLDMHNQTLSENYSLGYELALSRYGKDNIDIDMYKEKVKSLKEQIKSLGNVNLDSIEEYKEVKERFEFLDTQVNDLIAAKEKLESAIANLDEIVAHRFKLTFDKIKVEFKETYITLFGGGNADLILTDPDNLLETGVEIIAEPPGKKLQIISLLSGGEKSLTAIALLLAIIKVRPIPFCILDEVEAALDEANVKRYAKYIKAFSKRTQFLVISHRKPTMEHADSLFGVTMQEKGVSTILNVSLNESDKFID